MNQRLTARPIGITVMVHLYGNGGCRTNDDARIQSLHDHAGIPDDLAAFVGLGVQNAPNSLPESDPGSAPTSASCFARSGSRRTFMTVSVNVLIASGGVLAGAATSPNQEDASPLALWRTDRYPERNHSMTAGAAMRTRTIAIAIN